MTNLIIDKQFSLAQTHFQNNSGKIQNKNFVGAIKQTVLNSLLSDKKQDPFWLKYFPQQQDTVTIWILDTRIQVSSEYWTVWVSSIQMVKSRDLAAHLNTGHFGPLKFRFSDHHSDTRPLDNRTLNILILQTQIYHSNTRLVRYSDGYCTRENKKVHKKQSTVAQMAERVKQI